MDIDPLADTVPPRYAIESDEEEDEGNPLRIRSGQPEEQNAQVKFLGDLPTGRTLVIATGDAAKHWAKGAELGEQAGSVAVNGVEMGLVFTPSWTKSVIIVSEVLSRLPVWAMHPYAQTIIDTLKPTSVSLLDSYPVPSYVNNKPVSIDDAPLRYLATIPTDIFNGKAELFAPPNLIQSTSASFLSILSIKFINGFLVLLPSPHIPHPAPKTIAPSNFQRLAHDDIDWSSKLVVSAHELVFKANGEPVAHPWKPQDPKSSGTQKTSKRRFEVGEGGMYI